MIPWYSSRPRSRRVRSATRTIRPEADFFDPGALPLAAHDLPGEFQLRRALEVVDYAIAQQTLLNGDVMLPQLSELYFDPVLTSFTDGNVALAFNVMRYSVYEVAEHPGSKVTADAYAAALASNDPTVMQGMMTRVRSVNGTPESTPLPVRRIAETSEYQIQIGQKWLPMPTVEEFRNREFVVSAPLQRLVSAREALLDVLAGYEMLRLMTPEERARYYRLALIH
jgi:hypothetical protein